MSRRIFTTQFTSTVDGVDHAVSDEEFFDHRPEPTAGCGTMCVLVPMTVPSGEHCLGFLLAHELSTVDQRRPPHRHRRAGLLARLPHRDIPTRPITSARMDDRAQTAAETIAALRDTASVSTALSTTGIALLGRPAALSDRADSSWHLARGQSSFLTPVGAVASPTIAPTGPHTNAPTAVA